MCTNETKVKSKTSIRLDINLFLTGTYLHRNMFNRRQKLSRVASIISERSVDVVRNLQYKYTMLS